MKRLIERARAGDRAAIDELVASYQTPVRTYASLVAPAPDMAEDIAQEVFIELMKSLPRFDPSRDFGSWLRGIARNVARSHWKRLARERAVVRDSLAEYIEEMAESVTLRPVDADDQIAALRACVEKLPPKSRKIVSLHYHAGMKCREVGAELRTSVAAVKMALVRIRQMIRECLGEGEVARG